MEDYHCQASWVPAERCNAPEVDRVGGRDNSALSQGCPSKQEEKSCSQAEHHHYMTPPALMRTRFCFLCRGRYEQLGAAGLLAFSSFHGTFDGGLSTVFSSMW